MRQDISSADYRPENVIKNNFDWILNERDTLEAFVQKIQGKTLEQQEDGIWKWKINKDMIPLVNSRGGAFIKTYLESVLTKGAKTTLLNDYDIFEESKRTARDMRFVFILKKKEMAIDDVFIAPLKHMIERFTFNSLRKSKDAKMLSVITDTTKQTIQQTTVSKTEGEKGGLFGIGRMFGSKKGGEDE